jgi:hypothetical protein
LLKLGARLPKIERRPGKLNGYAPFLTVFAAESNIFAALSQWINAHLRMLS